MVELGAAAVGSKFSALVVGEGLVHLGDEGFGDLLLTFGAVLLAGVEGFGDGLEGGDRDGWAQAADADAVKGLGSMKVALAEGEVGLVLRGEAEGLGLGQEALGFGQVAAGELAFGEGLKHRELKGGRDFGEAGLGLGGGPEGDRSAG